MIHSIRQKLILFAFIILAGNGVLGYAVYNSNQKRLESEKWVDHTEQVIYQADKILSIAKDIETASRGYIITRDSSFLKPSYQAKREMLSAVIKLRVLIRDNPSQQLLVDSLDLYMHQRLDFSFNMIKIRNQQGMAAAVAYTSTRKGKQYTDRIRQVVNTIQQNEKVLLDKRKQINQYSVKVFNQLSVLTFTLMSGFTILLLVGIGNYLIQNEEKEKRAAELLIAGKELMFQSNEKEKRAAELAVANVELSFQNEEKEKRAQEFVIANKELVFQNDEKGKRAEELSIANIELAFQNGEKEKRAAELVIANAELSYQNEEKGKRAAELLIANNELFFQNEEKGKRAEELKRVNRLYAFTSQINQNILHVKDEDALFHTACSIALEFGKFKIAWIGLFDDTRQKITRLAQIGIPVEDIRQFKNIPFNNNGPQQSVLQNGKYYICNDILNDPELISWKPLAEKQGICSCMILPITKSGNIMGTFNLYATELDFFNKEEIKLLVELAGDISFALDMFEKEKAHRHTQELVEKNEKRFRVLIEKSADIITLSNRKGELIYGSPFITEVLGYQQDELLNMPIFDILHPDDVPEFTKDRDTLLKTPGSSFYFQQRRRHKNGNWVWCEGTYTNMLQEPGINAIVSNFRDITAKRIMEQQRDFDSNNLNALINNTDDLMWSVDKAFNLITSNHPFDEFLKVMFGQAIPKGGGVLSTGFPPEQLIKYKAFYERAFSGESFTEIEYTELPVAVWSEVSYSPIRKGEEVIGTACYSRNITEKMKAERQIINNEKRFRALVENGADAVAILSPDGGVIYISPSIANILGYTEQEAMERDMFSLIHPDDLAGVAKIWEQMLLSPGVPVSVNAKRIIHKDGTWRWLEGTLTNLLHDPAVNGVVDNFRDVTQKKLAEDALLLTQLAIDNAGDAVFWMTRDANIVNVNQAACIMLGYTQQDMVKLSIPDIDPYFNMEKWPDHFAELRQKGTLFFETIQKTKDGRLIPVEIRANYIKFGDEEFNCAFSRDISERRIAEGNLVKSETKLKEAQAIAQIGNFEVDLLTKKEVWSDELYKMHGLVKGSVAPSIDLFLSFVHPDDLARVRAIVDDSMKTFQNNDYDFRFIDKDGHIRYGYTEAKFEFDNQNKPIRIFGIFQDITKAKIAEIERIKIVSDLMVRNTELEQFAYIISHNLRAPVANIIGASTALKDPELNEEDIEILNRGINTSVMKLDDVVKDLNSILEVKAEINETKELVNFSGLVNDIKDSIKNLIDKDSIKIKYDFSEIDEFFTLKPYLYSIFYNLISNSVKYRRQNVDTLIEIKSRLLKNRFELIFTDNGMGIDLEKRGGQVFGLYKRFHTGIEGKGMGLFMIKTQVEALGGKINIKSIENEGTQFIIDFEV